MIYAVLTALLVVCCVVQVAAQAAPPLRYGAWGALSFNLHAAGFSALPGVGTCCTGFEHGSGVAPGGGALVDIPLSPSAVISARAGILSYSALITATENKLVPNRTRTGLTAGVIEHSIDAALPAFGAELLFGHQVAGRFTAYAGMRGDILLSATFAQKETLLEPSYGTFENDSRVRNERSGDIPGAAPMLWSALAGVSYETPLNSSRTLVVAPELMFSLGLTPIAGGIAWKAHAVRFGLAVKYTPPATVPPPAGPLPSAGPSVAVVPPADNSTSAAETTAASVAPPLALEVVGVGGDTLSQSSLRIEEVVVTDLMPLLTYVFFDEGSSVLPARYHRLRAEDTAAFFEERIDAPDALGVYHHVLNILGRRLRTTADAAITLTGCTSETGSERTAGDLASRRAVAVRDYLLSVWGIDPARIRIATRGLPAQPSNSAHADGREENRRVEISSDRWEIVRPVVQSDTVRVASPPLYRLYPIAAAARQGRWSVGVAHDGGPVDELSGEGPWPDSIEWPVNRVLDRLPTAVHRLTLTARMRSEGTALAAVRDIPVEWKTLDVKRTQSLADRTIDRYSLLLFNFDDATPAPSSLPVIDLIRERITPASSVQITGYTDRTGEADYNRRLSGQRAAQTQQALGVSGARIDGRGNDVLLYTNDLPEGRLYCRTVTITVETPVER